MKKPKTMSEKKKTTASKVINANLPFLFHLQFTNSVYKKKNMLSLRDINMLQIL